MNTANQPKITVETTVNLTIDSVWSLWTTPEHITQWNNASNEWHTPRAENDLRPGGKFLSRMEARDGSFGFDFEGVYDEIRTNEFISYSMSDGRKVEISFIDEGSSTRINEVFDAESENSLAMQQEGWQAILTNFKAYAESSEII